LQSYPTPIQRDPFLFASGIFAGVQLEQQHNIEARAACAVRILQNNYVNQAVRRC